MRSFSIGGESEELRVGGGVEDGEGGAHRPNHKHDQQKSAKKSCSKITRIGDDHGDHFRFNSKKYNFWVNQKYIYNFFWEVLQEH